MWRDADGYVTITRALADELTRRFGPRPQLAVVPDGMRPPQATPGPLPGRSRSSAYAGHLYAWKGVDVLLRALAQVPGRRGLIVGGHAAEPDLARVKAARGGRSASPTA